MESVRVIFTRNWLPGSRLIRARTWSRWSHVALIDGDEVVEAAMFAGVRSTPLADLIAASSAYSIQHLPVRDAATFIAAVRSQIGAGYDWPGALGIGLRLDLERSKWYSCAELLAWAAHETGQPWFRPDRIGRVTPEHLWMLAPYQPASARYLMSGKEMRSSA